MEQHIRNRPEDIEARRIAAEQAGAKGMNSRLWLVVIALAIGVLACIACTSSGGSGGGGGSDLDSPEWDRYFGCLVIQEDWGHTKAEARDICEQYRP